MVSLSSDRCTAHSGGVDDKKEKHKERFLILLIETYMLLPRSLQCKKDDLESMADNTSQKP